MTIKIQWKSRITTKEKYVLIKVPILWTMLFEGQLCYAADNCIKQIETLQTS